MTVKKIMLSAITLAIAGNALAVDIPSNEELMRKGRAMVQGMDKKVDIEMLAPSRGSLPMQQPEHMSPLAKELMKETLSAKLDQSPGKKNGQPDLMIFVSFSMPDKMLIEYSKQAKEAGATLVLRGLVENSITKTQLKAARFNPVIADWEINPGSFRKFKIDKVPSIVIADATNDETESSGCAVPKSYLRVDGDLSIKQALYTMGWRGEGHLALQAKQKLKSMEER
jgi:conjugal transfer pilus assembly protein TrbC